MSERSEKKRAEGPCPPGPEEAPPELKRSPHTRDQSADRPHQHTKKSNEADAIDASPADGVHAEASRFLFTPQNVSLKQLPERSRHASCGVQETPSCNEMMVLFTTLANNGRKLYRKCMQLYIYSRECQRLLLRL